MGINKKMEQKDFKIGKPYSSSITGRVFVVVKYYDDDGILFKSTEKVIQGNTVIENHKFKINQSGYKNFIPHDFDYDEPGGHC